MPFDSIVFEPISQNFTLRLQLDEREINQKYDRKFTMNQHCNDSEGKINLYVQILYG